MSFLKFGPEFLVNTTTTFSQNDSAVTALSDGRFVVTWTDGSALGSETSVDVRGQIFAADGSKSGGEFLVNTTTTVIQYQSSVTALSDGRFVVTWTDTSATGGDTSNDAVRGQIFAANGSKSGPEFLVNTTTTFSQSESAVTALSDGRFVVTWTDDSRTGGDTSLRAVRGQIFAADGSKSGAEFLVNTITTNSQYGSSVTALSDGRFVVTWTDESATSGDTFVDAVRGQIFAANGAKVGTEFLVNTTTANVQSESSVTALSDGRFVVTWSDLSATGGDRSAHAVRGQIFAADGSKSGGEFLVNRGTFGSQTDSSVTALSDGRFVVTWTDNSGDTSFDAVRAQIFDARFYTGDATAETVIGGTLADTIQGGGGADLLWSSYGADGVVDFLQGDGGSDTYIVYETTDVVTETDANTGTGGLDLIYSFSNRTLSANVEYLSFFGNNAALNAATGNDGDNALNAMQYVGGSGITFTDNIGNDIVFASYYADTINTGVGNDTLWGSWGADGRSDAMAGGSGADTYYVQEALDTVTETNTSTAASEADTVYSGINYTLGGNLEYLFIYGSATVATGNGLNNALIGSYSGLQLTFNGMGGNDSITGGAGNDTIDGGAGVDYLTGSGGADTFRFVAGETNGDYIIDFNGAGAGSLDSLRFVGYGAGATFSQNSASQWRITYNGGASTDIINIFNSAPIHATDYTFV